MTLSNKRFINTQIGLYNILNWLFWSTYIVDMIKNQNKAHPTKGFRDDRASHMRRPIIESTIHNVNFYFY